MIVVETIILKMFENTAVDRSGLIGFRLGVSLHPT